MRKRDLVKLVLLAIKSSPCNDCGFFYPTCVMDFDHLFNKKINIADAAGRWTSIPRLLREIAKCELVCSNCHRIRTWKRKNRMSEAETAKKKMTKEDVVKMLKERKKADGTPFKKHEGPRKQRGVSADGLKVALGASQNDEQKVSLVKAFGSDGRKALKELCEANPTDESLKNLLEVAFPGTGTGGGRPYQDSIKTTVDGKAVISGFAGSARVKVDRHADGSVTVTPLTADENAEADKTEAAQPSAAPNA